MPLKTVQISAKQDSVKLPILWRLDRLFNVVTNIRRARVSDDSARAVVEIEGSTPEVAQAIGYLNALGLCEAGPDTGSALTPQAVGSAPEANVPQPHTIYIRLTAVNSAQAASPLLYRLGKDFDVVVNIERAAFDDEEENPGWIEIALSGPLAEVQRAITYLHTTGTHVFPQQRSVTDYSNL